MDDLSLALNNSGIGGYLGDPFLNHLCYADDICLISLSSDNVVRYYIVYSMQCIRKVTSHESQSGSRKFNLREPLFCYGSHI